MTSLTKLLFDENYSGDRLRYAAAAKNSRHGAAAGIGPVIVWNSTRRCNLFCRHCYLDAGTAKEPELTTAEAKNFIAALAAYRVPALLVSGGEPLLRDDFFELADFARERNIRVTLSTNGTLITPAIAAKIKAAGVAYVGISLDGIGKINDEFRGMAGAFDRAAAGIRNCVAVGQRVGLRFTINARNVGEIPAIFDFIERENIARACFYHLVYAGRGAALAADDLPPKAARAALDLIIERTRDFARRGLNKEILTVDNHCDGIYLYLAARAAGDTSRAGRIKALLLANGGNRSGIAFGAVDPAGNVHPDQFTQHITFGNVKEKPFGEIWENAAGLPLLAGLKERKNLLSGRCAACRFLAACNGNFRARAEAATGDFWASDPACYLTEEEIKAGF